MGFSVLGMKLGLAVEGPGGKGDRRKLTQPAEEMQASDRRQDSRL